MLNFTLESFLTCATVKFHEGERDPHRVKSVASRGTQQTTSLLQESPPKVRSHSFTPSVPHTTRRPLKDPPSFGVGGPPTARPLLIVTGVCVIKIKV